MWSFPMCLSCKHYQKPANGAGAKCDAFPTAEGIPDAIFMGGFDHRQRYRERDEAGRVVSDRGIVFDLDPKAAGRTGPTLVEIEASFIRGERTYTGDEIRESERAMGLDDDTPEGEE